MLNVVIRERREEGMKVEKGEGIKKRKKKRERGRKEEGIKKGRKKVIPETTVSSMTVGIAFTKRLRVLDDSIT